MHPTWYQLRTTVPPKVNDARQGDTAGKKPLTTMSRDMINICRRIFTKNNVHHVHDIFAQATKHVHNVSSPCQQRGQIQGFVPWPDKERVALQLPCKKVSLDMGAPGIFPRTEPVKLHVGVPAQYDLPARERCPRNHQYLPRKGRHEPTISGRQANNVDTNQDGCHSTARMCTSTLHHEQPRLVQRCVHKHSLALSLRSSLQIWCCEIAREPGVRRNNRVKLSQSKVRHANICWNHRGRHQHNNFMKINR